jgi:pSer/pThr/pTyr-binding forkhead associated (FHA) protein
MENCTFTVGRKGDISIEEQTVSRNHVEIQVTGSAIYLRNLSSTNGTFLLSNNHRIPFTEGYVQPYQVIILGIVQCRVQKLLDLAKNLQGKSRVRITTYTKSHPVQKNRSSIWV